MSIHIKQQLSPEQISALKNKNRYQSDDNGNDLEILKQAMEVQSRMASIGVDISDKPSLPPKDESFIEINNLPSKGLFYKNKISGQPLKVVDLLLIQSLDDSNVQSRFDQIFNRRLHGIDSRDILLIDELYIAYWLRANSFPEYDMPSLPFICDHCAHDTINDNVSFNWLHMKWDVPKFEEICKYHENGFHSYTLPDSNIEVNIYLKRRLHTQKVNDVIKKRFTAFNKKVPTEYLELLNIASILDDGNNDIENIARDIQELTANDFVKLINEINKVTLTVDTIVDINCPKCGEVNTIWGYPFRPEIFLPTES